MRMLLVCLIALSAQAAAAEKELKAGEREVYNEAIADVAGSKFTKAIADLDSWAQKSPDSDYRDERSLLYVQAYAGANQPAKSLDAAKDLLAHELPAGDTTIVRLLYVTAWAISHIPDPTAEQLALGDKAAHALLDYDREPAGLAPGKWAEARADMKEKATAAILYMAMLPGMRAMAKQPPDCGAAEAAYTKALQTYPDKPVLSYELGRALNCQAKQSPEKFREAIYHFERAAVIDPSLGEKVRAFADNTYVKFHGSSDGLDQLKQDVKKAAFPPADFSIRSAAEIAEQAQRDFENSNPQLALWMKIKTALLEGGDQYFEGSLKGTAVPELAGTLVEARPACRPKELLIAVSPGVAEISLKLDKALGGKPELNTAVRWEGVPSAFIADPFLLTMDADTANVRGLSVSPCVAGPVKRR